MKVMVTGAAGFIGSHVADELLACGHEVVAVDSFEPFYARADKEANRSSYLAHPRCSFVEADLATADLEPLLDGCDAVVNQAALPGLTAGWAGLDRYLAANVQAVDRLARACTATGVRTVVHASTSSVYGGDVRGGEDAPTRPISPYGVTKLAGESVLIAHHLADSLPVTILRYFSVYGPRQRPDMAFRAIGERLLRGEPVTIHGDGQQSRTNTYVADCVRATVGALEQPQPGRCINIGGGVEMTLLEGVELLAEILEVEPVLRFDEARVGDQRRTVADCSLAADLLGWSAQTEPVEGLRYEAAWLRDRLA